MTALHANTRPPKKSRKKIVLIILAVILLLAAAFATYKIIDQNRINKQKAQDKAAEAKQNEEVKERTADRTDDKADTPTTDPKTDDAKNAGDIPVLSTNLGVVINRVTHNNPGDPVAVRATISGTTFGECTTTFSKSGQPDVVKTFPVSFEASAVTCGAADIKESDFPAGGEWKVKVTITSDGKISAPAESQVTIEK